jgi:methylglutaconyl-CoA hydratase
MNAPTATLRVTRNGAVLTVELRRPEARNALNDVLVRELSAVFRGLAADATLRAVLVVGEGASLCAGADIAWMRTAGTLPQEENEKDALELAGMFDALRAIPCPTLCLAHGAALGGGVGLVLAADVAIAEEGCKFGFTEVRLGLIPSVISQVAVPVIGDRFARRTFLSGEVFDARAALAAGLVSEVVPAGSGRARLQALADVFAAAAPNAVRAAKALLERYRESPKGPGAVELAKAIARLRSTPEAREGLSAFLEKREPAWRVKGAP